MSLNYKGILQEYCQKNCLSLPLYLTKSDNSNKLQIKWNTMIEIGDILNSRVMSDAFNDKKGSEQDAARKLYNKLTNITNNNHIIDDLKIYNTSNAFYNLNPVTNNLNLTTLNSNDALCEKIYFVDLENIQPEVPLKFNNKNTNIHYFSSMFSSVVVEKYSNYGQIHIINNSNSDATDHYMTYFVAKLLPKLHFNVEISIVSRDKSSSILTYLLTQDGFKVNHLTTAEQFKQDLLK